MKVNEKGHGNQSVGSSSNEIESRLAFMQLDSLGRGKIRCVGDLIRRELPVALDKFYDQLRKTPEASRFFSGEDHISHARGAQIGHWSYISEGNFNAEYAKKIHIIGAVHARIGLDPRWYIGGYAIVMGHLITSVITEMTLPRGFFGRKRPKMDEVSEIFVALVKAVFLDMDLAISVYIEEAKISKQKGQDDATSDERKMIIDSFGKALSQIAENNLSYTIQDRLPEAYTVLRDDFNNAISHLSKL